MMLRRSIQISTSAIDEMTTTTTPTFAPTPYYFNFVDEHDTGILSYVYIIVILISIIACFCYICEQSTRYDEYGGTVLEDMESDCTQFKSSTSGSREEERLIERRLMIMTSIIHKKIQAKHDDNNNNYNKEEEEKNMVKHELQVDLSHEVELSQRALAQDVTSLETRSDYNDVDDDDEEIGGLVDTNTINTNADNRDNEIRMFPIPLASTTAMTMTSAITTATTPTTTNNKETILVKDDIVENQKLKSIRNDLQIPKPISSMTSSTLNTTLYSPKICPICLETYKAGDDIVWSKNEKCYHAYHLGCIENWLMDHNECPICANNYFVDECYHRYSS